MILNLSDLTPGAAWFVFCEVERFLRVIGWPFTNSEYLGQF
jgi:hypothetical protein